MTGAPTPRQLAERAEEAGLAKAAMRPAAVFPLAVLAGAFIAMGAVFSTTVIAGTGDMAYGVTRLLGGLAFTLGLILVVTAGAELFTGNVLIAVAWASRRVRLRALAANWALVYAGNAVGALTTVGLMVLSRQYEFGGGAVGEAALATGAHKLELGWLQAVALGAFCNALVCLAVWLAYGARSIGEKVVAVIPPVAAFVAAGFEHSIANLYFVPYALAVDADARFAAGHPQTGLDGGWTEFLTANLLPVTIGNVIGGAVMVGAVYWFVFLRGRPLPELPER